MAELLRRGSTGDAVRQVQTYLNTNGFNAGTADGIFGAGTETAVKAFQASKGLSADGVVGPGTWDAMFPGTAMPGALPAPETGDLDSRCLALVGTFETGRQAPECFAGLSGNFDGQGISFGALQWNIGQGSLQPLISSMCSQHWDVVERVFGADAQALRTGATSGTKDQQMAWADSIQDAKHRIQSPWNSTMEALGLTSEYQAIQVQAAGAMFNQAIGWCRDYGLHSQRAVALMFNIRVQNGSISSAVKAQIMQDFKDIDAAGKPADEVPYMKAIAMRRSAACNERWIEDVRTRMLTIAEGTGTVHGLKYDLAAQYGITLDTVPGL